MGYMVALFGGGAVYYLTRSALLGWKDQLGRDTRLTVGAVLFIAGGLLDLAAWFFKPE
jgi:hypothetical protein